MLLGALRPCRKANSAVFFIVELADAAKKHPENRKYFNRKGCSSSLICYIYINALTPNKTTTYAKKRNFFQRTD
ncbi:MAG: hypothetical protein J6X31_06365, partial [Bacteroidales bacterium]|nr:hypothetical protein [Bacteroidales bacterium]